MNEEKLIAALESELYGHELDMDGYGNGFEEGLKKAIEIVKSQSD